MQPKEPIPAQWPQGAACENGMVINQTMEIPKLSLQEFSTDQKLQKIIDMTLNKRDLRLAALNIMVKSPAFFLKK